MAILTPAAPFSSVASPTPARWEAACEITWPVESAGGEFPRQASHMLFTPFGLRLKGFVTLTPPAPDEGAAGFSVNTYWYDFRPAVEWANGPHAEEVAQAREGLYESGGANVFRVLELSLLNEGGLSPLEALLAARELTQRAEELQTALRTVFAEQAATQSFTVEASKLERVGVFLEGEAARLTGPLLSLHP